MYALKAACLYYLQYENYPKVIKAYESGDGYAILSKYPEQIRKGTLELGPASGYITVLLPVVESYARVGDRLNTEKNIRMGEEIRDAILKKLTNRSYDSSRVEFAFSDIYYFRSRFLLKDFDSAISIQRSARAYLFADTVQDKDILEIEKQYNARFLVETFMDIKQYDSAQHYLEKLDSSALEASDMNGKIYEYRAALLVHKGKYQEAHDLLVKARMIDKEFKISLMEEMDELLYAHTESEWNRNELQRSETSKKHRTIWLISIIVIAAGTILAIYILMQKEKKRARARIKALNEITSIQIAEAKHHAAREAQEELGQDLHDELSASLAGVSYQLERLALQSDDPQMKDSLQNLQNNTKHIYESVRNKSHNLFMNATGIHQQHFDDSIKKIVNSALPEPAFTNEFEIEKEVAACLTLGQRIELLRIIQEAVSNIMKHSKANETAVFLFRENEGTAMLQISDNGKGFPGGRGANKASGIGLQSIRRRVETLQGKVEIINDNGTTLAISFPCSEQQQ